ncbi:FAD-binding oxidoreductase [Myxococcus llanfairpwllgwyngyllgogerychwyrndrobwllllantysiliogogogochensis]|uniref:FAD-binding oxidoreductase n=1 Tax=Myxococcus llanfairpwllgwyngyllgogerychwyrndrobwllllantysiliogogogochensis TaxID=2590453 RepID=A0A540X0C4_9BACT|nr:FAD-dependent oxidoreductase [Myxococcus llanfairpwllgwyngyllgogerychwyrndrobwllllantysiliogogogochensis]TQF14725.1 FAD-binding oxidoreductase [Myxococcus llanfairpwllgwyngyllgogerychwyrndrobwllllantysiliogogogochensis]
MSSSSDVVVLGAGVVGLSAARRLAATGARVTVLDAVDPGGRGSRAAAGVAIPSVRLYDDPAMLAFSQAGRATLADELASLPEGHLLRRGQGILRIAADAKGRDVLAERAARHPDELGTWVDAARLVELEPALEGTPLLGAFESARGHMVDTEGYVNALLGAALRAGVRLRLGESARSVEETSDAVVLRTDRETLRADQLIVSAGPWSSTFPGLPPLPLKPVRGQMLVVHQPGLSLSRVVSGPTYLAPWRAGEIVVGATEEDVGFVENVTPAGLLHLSATVAKLAPRLREARFVRAWAGLRAVTPDGRPYLGRYPGTQRTFVATGLGGQGILTGAHAATVLVELVAWGRTELAAPFAPGRASSLKAVVEERR